MKYTVAFILASGYLCIACPSLHAQTNADSRIDRGTSDRGDKRGESEGGKGRGAGHGGGRGASPQSFEFQTDVPAHDVDVVLCRPTATGVTVSVLVYVPASGFLRYGTDPKSLIKETPVQSFSAGVPSSMVIQGLRPNSTCYYQLVLKSESGAALTPLAVENFHTQRAPGASFTFAIQADSHLDSATNTAVYATTLQHVTDARPDFLIDLGDTFMTDKHADRASASRQYLAQRYYFGSVCKSVPLFLALGNHDGESGRLSGGPDSLAAWSNSMRKKYFPNPVPDQFYKGNAVSDIHAGLLEDYYSWTWGDALFVVLDPFWYTGVGVRGPGEPWDRTLGEGQYRWLESTLKSSKAKYKFVFIHHLVGGADRNARGGAEASRLFEWGGNDLDGRFSFDTRRPDWSSPIHQLMVEQHVSAVFHGHDHFFMKQERDGVIYQLVPQPGHKGQGSSRSAAEYGYVDGDILTGSGYLRVGVSEATATIDFVRTMLQPGGAGSLPEEEIACRYEISAQR